MRKRLHVIPIIYPTYASYTPKGLGVVAATPVPLSSVSDNKIKVLWKTFLESKWIIFVGITKNKSSLLRGKEDYVVSQQMWNAIVFKVFKTSFLIFCWFTSHRQCECICSCTLTLNKPVHPFIAARQKEKASGAVAELVEALKRPRSFSESKSRPWRRKSKGNSTVDEEEEAASRARRRSENLPPPSRRSSSFTKTSSSMQCITEFPEKKQYSKSSRRSFMG